MAHQLIVEQISSALQRAANPAKASEMQAYMKTEQPFLGVSAPDRKKIVREAVRQHPFETRRDYEHAVRAFWRSPHREEPYREEMYTALELATCRKKWIHEESLPLYIELVHSATWWDTLDWIAGQLISPLLLQNRELESRLIEWRTDDSLWVRRAALLSHLKHRKNANVDLIGETVLLLADESDFFIRKAIGWILRDASYAHPEWVEQFVTRYHDHLSPLSRREAMKAIERWRAKNV